ncbi:uncharacterized protein LOC133204678 [Saccostrea echinata]|uniref:uncharacterized protein LOC133204678 n=1 Tax=Saccostrea echinata TaxID=191078 RepID=UPI002A813DCF|nr:uncharacterized protein LOC133204678 [Saccostrea echinata]
MGNKMSQSLWIFILIIYSSHAVMITYIVESHIFCDMNSSEIDSISKSISVFVNETSTSLKQLQLDHGIVTFCAFHNLDEDISNYTDLIVFISENETTNFSTLSITSNIPIISNTYDGNNTIISTQYTTETLGNFIYKVLEVLEWPYIQVVLQPTPYYFDILNTFKQSRDSPYICAIRTFEVNSTSEREIELLLASLQYETNTKGILILTDDSVLQSIVQIWTANKDLEQFYFVALVEDSGKIKPSLESIPGWVFIPRHSANLISESFLYGNLSITNIMEEVRVTTVFLMDALSNVNSSACDYQSKEEDDACLQSRWIFEMRLKEEEISVYNVQIDQLLNNRNIAMARFVQVGKMDNGKYLTMNPMKLYDKNNLILKSNAVSWSEAFAYICRSFVKFQRLTSPTETDIQIIGSLPLHYPSYTPEGCGELRDNYILLTEALIFAIEYVNNMTNILPNLKLGYDIIDTCTVPSRFIHQMYILNSRGLRNTTLTRKTYIGGVGFPFSSEVEHLAGYLSSKEIPTISISATSSVFSDKILYPYFMRMVPSNKEETLAIIGVLEYLSIHTIGIVYTNDAFGADLTKSVLQFAEEKGIRVVYLMRMEESYMRNSDVLNYLVERFIIGNNNDVQAVVSLTQSNHMKAILQRLTDSKFNQVFWIGCDTWIAGIEESFFRKNIEVASNAILITFETKISEKFLKYLSRKQDVLENNLFIRQLVEKIDNCTFEANQPWKAQCKDAVNFQNIIEEIDLHGETHIIDAIFVLANGLDALIRTFCPLLDYCNEANLNKDKLAEIAQKLHVKDINGDQIYFDSKGDGKNIFYIMQINPALKIHTYEKIGMWLEGKTMINNDTLKIPKSMLQNNLQPCNGRDCYSLRVGMAEMLYTFIPGDVMIYAFLELFEMSNGTCSNTLILDHFEVASSVLWSIQTINKKQPKNNPRIGLGIFGVCGHDSTIAKSVAIPSFVVPKLPSSPFTKPILGFVGALTNPVASALSNARDSLSQDFPMIISATTEQFNDRNRFPRVFRTAMSSSSDVYIAMEFAKRLGWTYFHALFGDRDQSLLDLLEMEASPLNICLASKHTIKMSDQENELSKAVDKMLQYNGATVVMVFIPNVAIEMLLKVAHEKNTFGRLVFIIPKPVENVERILAKYSKPSMGLVILQNNMTENTQFKSYFQSLNIEEGDWSEQLPWGKRFWEDVHKCNLRFSNRYNKDCTMDLMLKTVNMKQSPYVVSTINGIYALSASFQNFLTKHCNSSDLVSCVHRNSSDMYQQLEHELDHVNVIPDGGTKFAFENRNASVPMAILNYQYGPKGNPRLVTIGSIQNKEITLDLRKLSMYNLNGARRIFKSECPNDQCSACLDPNFVSNYHDRVKHLSGLPPATVNSFESGVGLTTIFLIIIGVGVAVVCTYYLAKFSSHKIFSLSADGHACIILGTTIQILGAAVYLFDGSPLACGVHLALPGSVYSITLTGLLIKLNKTACLHAIIGTNITKLPKWDFALTYLPIVMSAPIIVFVVWNVSDPVTMTWSVPTLFEISNIDDISITWRCDFNRTEYAIFMTFFWIILFLCMTLSVIYKCRKTGRKEVKQVLLSATCFSLFTIATTIVRLLSNDHVLFRAFMSVTLPLNGIIILVVNFLPQIVDLMREKNRELLFSRLMSDNKSTHIAQLWKELIQEESTSKKKEKPKRKKEKEKVSMSVVGLSSKWRKKTKGQKEDASEA